MSRRQPGGYGAALAEVLSGMFTTRPMLLAALLFTTRQQDVPGWYVPVQVFGLLFVSWIFRPFAMQHPETAWALLEMMVQRVRDAENR